MRPDRALEVAQLLEAGRDLVAHGDIEARFAREQQALGPDAQLELDPEQAQHVGHHGSGQVRLERLEVGPHPRAQHRARQDRAQELEVGVEAHAQPGPGRPLAAAEHRDHEQGQARRAAAGSTATAGRRTWLKSECRATARRRPGTKAPRARAAAVRGGRRGPWSRMAKRAVAPPWSIAVPNPRTIQRRRRRSGSERRYSRFSTRAKPVPTAKPRMAASTRKPMRPRRTSQST